MSLEKVTKDHPLRREQKWERFLGEKVEAGFKCQVLILVLNNIEALLRVRFPLFYLDMRVCLGIEKSMDKLLDLARSTKYRRRAYWSGSSSYSRTKMFQMSWQPKCIQH